MLAWNKNYISQTPLQLMIAFKDGQWDVSKRKVCNFQVVSLKGEKQPFLTVFPLLCARSLGLGEAPWI